MWAPSNGNWGFDLVVRGILIFSIVLDEVAEALRVVVREQKIEPDTPADYEIKANVIALPKGFEKVQFPPEKGA